MITLIERENSELEEKEQQEKRKKRGRASSATAKVIYIALIELMHCFVYYLRISVLICNGMHYCRLLNRNVRPIAMLNREKGRRKSKHRQLKDILHCYKCRYSICRST